MSFCGIIKNGKIYIILDKDNFLDFLYYPNNTFRLAFVSHSTFDADLR
jgi:hypothetical protein